MGRGGCGCLPFLLGLVMMVLWFGDVRTTPSAPLEVETYDPRSPRRPLPEGGEEYMIEDKPAPADSLGTAFVIDRDGVWLTAEHVTAGCDRVGLENGRAAVGVTRVLQSQESDASLIRDGIPSDDALAVTSSVPQPGARGYHMGFPAGEPTLVISQLLGSADARRGRSSSSEPVLAWAEQERIPGGEGTLSGISGGPTLDARGRVVGINSAATDRRGRVLTTDPRAVMRLVRASQAVDDAPTPRPIFGPGDAATQFEDWLDRGLIRRIYCDVR